MSQIIGLEKHFPMRTPVSVSNAEEMRAYMMSEQGMGGPGGGPDGPGAFHGDGSAGPGFPDGELPDFLKALQTPTSAAVYVKDGAVLPERTVSGFVYGGTVSDEHAEHLRIVGYTENTGGVYAEGAATRFALKDSVISLNGAGMGLGGARAGVGVGDHGELEVRKCVITTNGANRSASSCSDGGILRVYDSSLVSQGAPYGDDAPENRRVSTTPPAALEILGNSRTHCTTSHGKSYFYNCTVVGDGWAVLSTDGADGYVYLEANDTRVVATKSGYGTYSDKFCHVVLNRCDMDCGTMAAILDGEASIKMTDCRVRTGKYFAFIHVTGGTPAQVGEFDVENCDVSCVDDVFSIRGHNLILKLKNSTFRTEKGRFLHTRFNEDNAAPKVRGRTVYGYRVFLDSMSVTGDIVHEDPDREMVLDMTASNITGAIVNANLTMDRGSSWYATADSTVTFCNCEVNIAQLDAPKGVTIHAKGAAPAMHQLASGGQLIVE